MNSLQISAAFAKVHSRPGSGLDEWTLAQRQEFLSTVKAKELDEDA